MSTKIFYITIYKDKDLAWRWVVKDRFNRLVIGESHKGFDKVADARRNMEKLTGLYAPAINLGEDKNTERVYAGSRNHKRI